MNRSFLSFSIFAIIFIMAVAWFSSLKPAKKHTTSKANDINIINKLPMKIESAAFKNGNSIQAKYTCDGENINPPLQFAEVPVQTKSLVLIVDDPDAPGGTWVHWLVWNISPTTAEIGENRVPIESTEGTTSFGKPGYGGPCPPDREHRYFFKLYALDDKLLIGPSTDKEKLWQEMQGHVLTQAQLMGKYNRQK